MTSPTQLGLTERIIRVFDPRIPLGRRRYLTYTLLYCLVAVPSMIVTGALIDPSLNLAKITTSIAWEVSGSILIIPTWLLTMRRARAALIPQPAIYGYMVWEMLFSPIADRMGTGRQLDAVIAIPSLILGIGLCFKRNRVSLPYPTRADIVKY